MIRMRILVGAMSLGAWLLPVAAEAEEAAAAEPVVAEQAEAPVGPYDPDSAWKQSLGYTIALVVVGGVVVAIDAPVGAVIVGLGVAFGPSIGHFYIDRWAHALGFAALRLGLGIASGACILSALGREPGVAQGLLAAGGGIAGAGALALAIYDIAVVARRAREVNRELATGAVALAPVVHSHGGGLALTGRF